MPIATLNTELKRDSARLHILPDGRFRSTDTRPAKPAEGWLIDADIAASLSARRSDRANKMLVDYEHQSILAAVNGKPAPAAGWSAGLTYTPGEGVYLTDIDWTQNAAALIKSGEYKYASAVFSYDEKTGAVTEVLSAAIKNMQRMDSPTTLHYVDPPYVPGTRKSDAKYRHEMGRDDHSELLECLQSLRGYVVLSGYANDLYDNVLDNWRRVVIPTRAFSVGKRQATAEEVLWIKPI